MVIEDINERLKSVISDGKIKYSKLVVDVEDRCLTFYFNSNVAVDEEKKIDIIEILSPYIPQSFQGGVKVVINKIIALDEFVKKAVLEFLNERHVIAFSSVTENDIFVENLDGCVKVDLNLESTTKKYFDDRSIGNELVEYLQTRFVEDFNVSSTDKGEAAIDARSLAYVPSDVELQSTVRRKLKVKFVTRLFDDDPTDEATYIADTSDLLGGVYIAGKIVSIKENVSKNDKIYYRLSISDKTGVLTGMAFPNKDKIKKMQKLEVGNEVIVRGEFEMREEYRNFRILSVNLCQFPENFVPQERPKKPVPENYLLVKPQPVVMEKQENFLEDKPVPECFNGRTFVVFDFETTGTDFDDKITEIGAVKILDGKITEYFSCLVDPKKHIPSEVQKLTGIDDSMVKDQPTFDMVCPDFFKFCHGATLVAHNIEFDARFLKNQSDPIDYKFDNPKLDTLALARECIYGVANYKLNTLCDKFGIVFRHHRAYSDALATAELLIEIIRIRGDFPF